jgi:competence protein ComEC
LGPLSWQVIAPSAPPSPESESPPNDSSLVLLVEVHGIRILLMGDEEEPSQSQVLRETGGVRADVLKVAHHGSANQDPDLVRGVGARLALISVGVDNDYGHPAPSLMAMLHDMHARVARTDQDGDVAVTVRDGELGLHVRGGRDRP